MAERVTILSPLDLKPGSVSPDGHVVKEATMYYGDPRLIAVHVEYTDGKIDAFSWPSGKGWFVNGRVGT